MNRPAVVRRFGAGVWLAVSAGLLSLSAHAQPTPSAPAPAAVSAREKPAAPRAVPSALERIRKAGVLRMGVLSQAPWAMLDRAGQWIGFDVDLGRQLAQDLGVRIEFQRVSWASADDAVATGQVDIVPGLWPGPRRALSVNFSASYAVVQVALLVKGGSTAPRLADYDRAEVSLAVLDRGLSEQVAGERLPHARRVAFDDPAAQLQAFADGRVDALVSRTPIPELLVQSGALPIGAVAKQVLAERSEALAIARRDPDFLAYLDAWLRFHRERGWLAQRREAWFSSVQWQSLL